MAPENDPSGVVTPKLLVRGLRGLRVVDASIMPRIPAAHTHAAVVMIAEKAGDLIKQHWGINDGYTKITPPNTIYNTYNDL